MPTRKRAAVSGLHIIIEYPFTQSEHRAIRHLPDYQWHMNNWTVPASPYHAQHVIQTLAPRGYAIDKSVERLAATGPKLSHAAEIARLEPRLRDYQVEGIDLIDQQQGRAILRGDPGVGKTPQALVFAKLRRLKRVLVVSPSSVLYKWQDEFNTWMQAPAQVIERLADNITTPGHAVVSWDYMAQRWEDLKRLNWQMIVFDEAHRMKNLSAKRTKAARTLGRGLPFLLFLTGTVIINRPADIWPLLNLIDAPAWPDFRRFRRDYEDYTRHMVRAGNTPGEQQRMIAQAQAKIQKELAGRLRGVVINQEKSLLKLPPIQPIKVPLALPASHLKEYALARQDLIAYLQREGLPSTRAQYAKALVQLGYLRRIVGRAKAEPAIDLALDILESDDKVILYAQHGRVFDTLREQPELQDVGVVEITGQVGAAERHKRAKAFQADGGPRVMLISEAGEEGIDLYRANHIIFVERPWTPKAEDQAMGRIDRMGQTRSTSAYFLIVKGTVDVNIDRLLERKRETIKNVLGSEPPNFIIRELLEQEMRQ